jgi:tRNA threonylcarbamoyladenosine biosynthesis protein TsaE
MLIDAWTPLVCADRATIIFLHGDLGAGKTTLVSHIARILGTTDHVASPTFVLERRYTLMHGPWERLVHIDAYRFETPQESHILALPVLTALPRTLICIEWPEKIQGVYPDALVTIAHTSETNRTLTVTLAKNTN